jgi:cbb3-type cytochrome oxidase subunit 3
MDWMRAREDLREIMRAQEYTDYARAQTPSLWDSLWERFIGFLEVLFQNNMVAVNVVSVWVLLVVAAVLAGGLVWIFWRMRRNVRARERGAQGFSLAEKTWRHCLTEADDWAAQHNYALAVRLLFQGFILFLHQREWIQLGEWKTNGQYLRELGRGQAQAAGGFSFIAGCFEDVVYGGRVPTSDVYKGCRARALEWMREED